jgi:hypothetical protein
MKQAGQLRWPQRLLVATFLLMVGLFVGLVAAPVPPTRAEGPGTATTAPMACQEGQQSSGALYRICMPTFPPWNGDLIVYAHGYMNPRDPIRIPEEQLHLPDGTYVPDVVNLMGYAFATTSYSANGLAVSQGLADLEDLVTIFRQAHPAVNRVLLVGVSEGGLITTLATESSHRVFSGGLALCGPVGDFGKQANYDGNFRVAFDYFFPGLLPGSAISVPETLMDNWDQIYAQNVLLAISDPAQAISVTQLLSVTQAAYDPLNASATASATISGVLWYNVFATNDALAKLGGQPFDNWSHVYSGSLDDARLNAVVPRYHADLAALQAIAEHYQTSGRPRIPLVTLHNALDPIVPYWHEELYLAKVTAQGRTAWYEARPAAPRYGHCNFTLIEIQSALTALRTRVDNPPSFSALLPLVQR